MKLIQLQLSSTLFLSLFASTDAISLHKRQDGLEPRVMSVPIQRRKVDDPFAHDRRRLNRRDGTVDVGIDNEVSYHEKRLPKQDLINVCSV
jgi:hypothetical protein